VVGLDSAIHPSVGWDASRPVPWRRLTKEWLIYASIMAVILGVFFRSGGRLLAILVGLLVSGPIYLALGYVLAKFGYQRKTLADMRTPRAAPREANGITPPDSRSKPAPTRRTSTGPSNRPRSKRR
jgi:hypothetical protein